MQMRHSNSWNTAGRRFLLLIVVAVTAGSSSVLAESKVWVSAPNDAEVRINGDRVGWGPLQVFRLGPGSYEVEVRPLRGAAVKRRLTVPEGKSLRFHVDARPKAVSTDPKIESGSQERTRSDRTRRADTNWSSTNADRVEHVSRQAHAQPDDSRRWVIERGESRRPEPQVMRVIHVYHYQAAPPHPRFARPGRRSAYRPAVYQHPRGRGAYSGYPRRPWFPPHSMPPQQWRPRRRPNDAVRVRNVLMGIGALGALTGNRNLARFGAFGALGATLGRRRR